MSGRHAEYGRPERHNEYFIPGEGISREVIQADICRYLGNDALVKPGTHNGRQGYLIRAYRNLTSEMITDLKADSARWEAEVSRRADAGYSRASYASSSIHELRQQGGPSAQTYAPQQAQYADPYGQPQYGAPQAQAYSTQAYPTSQSPYGSGQNPYASPPSNPYSGQIQPPVSSSDGHPGSYTYTSSAPGFGYEARGNAPRYTGPVYDNESEYSPVTSGMGYPAATAASDARMGMDPRYTPEAAYQDQRAQANRPQQTRDREVHRRPR